MGVLIGHRFRGPNFSGNGGYSAGAAAAALGRPLGPAEVSLWRPPPLDQELAVRSEGDGMSILDGEQIVATARPGLVDVAVPDPVGLAEAIDASHRCPWLNDHPYPQCFVCGTDRTDGLRIFPGPVAGRRLAAVPGCPTRAWPTAGWCTPQWCGRASTARPCSATAASSGGTP